MSQSTNNDGWQGDETSALDDDLRRQLDQALLSGDNAVHNEVIRLAHAPQFGASFEYLRTQGVPIERLLEIMTIRPANFSDDYGRPSPLGEKLLELVPEYWDQILGQIITNQFISWRDAREMIQLLLSAEPPYHEQAWDLYERAFWTDSDARTLVLTHLYLRSDPPSYEAAWELFNRYWRPERLVPIFLLAEDERIVAWITDQLNQDDLHSFSRQDILREVCTHAPERFSHFIYSAATTEVSPGDPASYDIKRLGLSTYYDMYPDETWPLIREAANSDDDLLVQSVVPTLGKVPDERALPILRDLVSNGTRDVATVAAQVWVERPGNLKQEDLRLLTSHRFRQVRELSGLVEQGSFKFISDREDVIAEIWERFDQDPHEVVDSVYGEVWGDPWNDVSESVVELATNAIDLFRAAWMRSRTSGGVDYFAYDLGDNFYYVRFHDDAYETGTRIVAAVPKDQAESELRRLTAELIETYIERLPDELSSDFAREPWFIRTTCRALMTAEIHMFLLDMTSFVETIEAEDEQALLEWWSSALDQTPELEQTGPPPGLMPGSDEEDPFQEPEFISWLRGVQLYWKDTGELLTDSEASMMRHTCQYYVEVGIY